MRATRRDLCITNGKLKITRNAEPNPHFGGQSNSNEILPTKIHVPGGPERRNNRRAIFSKREFQSHLPDTRIAGAGNETKTAPRINRPIRILELRVIENIKELSPKLEIHALINLRVLMQGEVPIV